MTKNNTTDSENGSENGNWTAPANQEELDSIIESRLARERQKYAGFDEMKSKAEKYDQAQAANQSDEEKREQRIAEAATQAAAATRRADLAEVALEKGLTPTQAKRLVGNTREELLAEADELLKDLGSENDGRPNARNQKKKTAPNPKDDEAREFAAQVFGRKDE